MKLKFLRISALLLLAILAACAAQPTAMPEADMPATESPQSTESSPSPSIPETGGVEDYDGLVNALEAAGATVEPGDEIEQAFFTVMGRIIKVNEADVQIFEYESAEAMEADAAQVSEDGGSIGTTMAMWVEAPHFFKSERILVLYVGEDQAIIDLLESALGPQFAGR
jgi:hypothetical protein